MFKDRSTFDVVVWLMFLILPLSSALAAPRWLDGVMIQKKGSDYIYIFPATRTRMSVQRNPAGEISIGRTISVMYSLKVMGRSRFIGLDASFLSAKQQAELSPRLSVIEASKTFGFMVRDSIQPMMHIHIEPSFMEGRVSTEPLQQKIAREGNLTVIFEVTKSGALRIVQAILD
jgi:hypothetical protein